MLRSAHTSSPTTPSRPTNSVRFMTCSFALDGRSDPIPPDLPPHLRQDPELVADAVLFFGVLADGGAVLPRLVLDVHDQVAPFIALRTMMAVLRWRTGPHAGPAPPCAIRCENAPPFCSTNRRRPEPARREAMADEHGGVADVLAVAVGGEGERKEAVRLAPGRFAQVFVPAHVHP